MEPLSARMIKNGVVYPTIRVASRPRTLLMGVYDADDSYVDDTALNRRFGEQGAPVPRDLFPVVSDADAPEAIYAGPLYFHFGHFLLESLARAWYTHRHPDAPFVWAGQHDWQGMELTPWQLEILDILMITNPTRIIADPTRFDLLHVPDIGYRYDDRFHPEHASFLGRYAGPAQVPDRRLWVSRGKIESDARDLNSGPTERRLLAAGWNVAHPETLSIREQLDQLCRAEIVAGEEGSAFHALILLKDVAAKKLHVLRRRGREHGNMHTIGDARGINQSFYSLQRELVLRAEGRSVSKISPNSAEVLNILDVPVPPARDAAPAPASEVLDRVLASLEPQRFLDVGDSAPHLVVGSSAPTRVAVSPRFDFDSRTYSALGIDFYELELTQYADLFHEDRGRFDVIRMAGSDFQEVMTSFRVSRRLSSDSTTWILGSGDLAARAALAVSLTQAGLAVKRLFVGGTTVYVVQQVPGEPRNEAGVQKLSAEEVKRRLRWIRPTTLRHLHRRRTGSRA